MVVKKCKTNVSHEITDDFLFSINTTTLFVGTEHLGKNWTLNVDTCEKIDNCHIPPSPRLTTGWDVKCLGRGRGWEGESQTRQTVGNDQIVHSHSYTLACVLNLKGERVVMSS